METQALDLCPKMDFSELSSYLGSGSVVLRRAAVCLTAYSVSFWVFLGLIVIFISVSPFIFSVSLPFPFVSVSFPAVMMLSGRLAPWSMRQKEPPSTAGQQHPYLHL